MTINTLLHQGLPSIHMSNFQNFSGINSISVGNSLFDSKSNGQVVSTQNLDVLKNHVHFFPSESLNQVDFQRSDATSFRSLNAVLQASSVHHSEPILINRLMQSTVNTLPHLSINGLIIYCSMIEPETAFRYFKRN